MSHQLQSPTAISSASTGQDPENSDLPTTFHDMFSDEFDVDSSCSTPYVSAPSSPGRNAIPLGGFYYSAPASPVHFILTSPAAATPVSKNSETSPASSTCSFEFDFSTRQITGGTTSPGSITTMTSADELFLNGQIRPMKHLDDDVDGVSFDVDEVGTRGRAAKYRDRSRRRARSMSPLRTMPFEWQDEIESNILEKNEKKETMENVKGDGNEVNNESRGLDSTMVTTQCESSSSSRSASVGRSSSRWVFLKEFLYRSKSEGRNNGHKFWGSLSFSPVKDKMKMEKFLGSKIPSNVSTKEKIAAESTSSESAETATASSSCSEAKRGKGKEVKKKTANGVGKRRVPPSPHELHYTANRAQAEEMRKKTFLPYRQGLLGCLGFSSKSCGAMNGFARTLNPVSSR